MSDRDAQRQAKAGKEPAFIGLVAGTVDPLEQTYYEAATGDHQNQSQVDDGHIEVAVHAVVNRRKGASRDEQVDAGIVESICN